MTIFGSNVASGLLGSDATTSTPLVIESGNPVKVIGITFAQATTTSVVSTIFELQDNDSNTLVRFIGTATMIFDIDISFLAGNGIKVVWISGGRPDIVRATVVYTNYGKSV